jgi:hypothetical protein
MSSPTDVQRLRFLSEQRLFLADGLQHIANQVSFSAATDAGSDVQPPASATSVVAAADGFTDTGADVPDPFECEALELLAPRSDATQCITDLQQFRSYALQAVWKAASGEGGGGACVPQHPFRTKVLPEGQMMRAARPPPAKDLGLLLLLPLLESQSRTDPALCGATVRVLLDFLLDVSPGAFTNAIPLSTLLKLEGMLTTWLEQQQDSAFQCDTLAALIALTCASGSFTSIAKAISLLGTFDESLQLPFGPTLDRLLHAEASRSSIILGKNIPSCHWRFDRDAGLSGDMIKKSASPSFKHPNFPHRVQLCTRGAGWNCDGGCGYRSSRATFEMNRYRAVGGEDFDLCANCMGAVVQQAKSTMATDGMFIYAAGWAFQGVVKVGTGFKGTIRGHIYARNTDLKLGRITLGAGKLLYRPHVCPSGVLCWILDPATLQLTGELRTQYGEDAAAARDATAPLTTTTAAPVGQQYPIKKEDICFSADGDSLYHVYLDNTSAGRHNAVPVIADTYDLTAETTSETLTLTVDISASGAHKLEADVDASAVGLKVTAVSGSSAADAAQGNASRAGLKELDRIVSVNGDAVATTAELQQCIDDAGDLRAVAIKVERGPFIKPVRRSTLKTKAIEPTSLEAAMQAAITMPVRPSGPGGAASGRDRDKMSSVGISVLSLRNCCAYASRGVLVVLCKSASTAYGAQTSRLPPSMPFGVRDQAPTFGGSLGGSPSRLTALEQTCINLGSPEETMDCPVPRVFLSDGLSESLTRLSEFCVCTELDSERIWLNVGSAFEVWPGRKFTNRHGPPLSDDDEPPPSPAKATIAEAMDSMFQLLQAGADERDSVDAKEMLSLASMSISILELAFDRRKITALLCGLKVLRLCLLSDQGKEPRQLHGLAGDFAKVKQHLLRHIAAPEDGNFVTRESKRACGNIVIIGFRLFSPSVEEQQALIKDVCTPSGTFYPIVTFRTGLLQCLPAELLAEDADLNPDRNTEAFFDLVKALLDASVQEVTAEFQCIGSAEDGQLDQARLAHTTASATVVALSGIQTAVLARVTREGFDTGAGDEAGAALIHRFSMQVMASCEEILDHLAVATKDVLDVNDATRKLIEAKMKCSPFGYMLPTIIALYASPSMDGLVTAVSSELVAQLRALLRAADATSAVLHDSTMLLDSISTPKPWERGVTLESIHPVRDNYKFSQTVEFAGAEAIYLTFDPRCCSQYDYDKLVVSTGKPEVPGHRVVAQYGGNTKGFGSRSVLSGGWPKSTVRVPGDTIHIEFEMRSGRESSTPDDAMWGFKITLGDQEARTESETVFSFHTDILLSLASWMTDLIAQYYVDSLPDSVETSMEALLKFDMLQNDSAGDLTGDLAASAAVVELPPGLKELLATSKAREPTYPPTVRDAVDAAKLQELFVVAALSCLGTIDTFEKITPGSTLFPRFVNVFDHIVGKLRGIERLLLDLSSYERLWWDAVEEIRDNGQKADGAFFHDWHLQDGKSKSLIQLCQLIGVSYIPDDKKKVVDDLAAALKNDVPQKPESRFPRLIVIASAIRDRCSFLAGLQLKPAQQWSDLIEAGYDASADLVSGDDGDAYRTYSVDVESLVAEPARAFSAPPVLEVLKMEFEEVETSKSAVLPKVEKAPLIDMLDSEFVKFVMHGIFEKSCRHSLEHMRTVVTTRRQRATSRCTALQTMRDLLEPSTSTSKPMFLVQFFVESFTEVLCAYPIDADLSCSGLAAGVREQFAATMKELTTLIAANPITCYRGIGLCTIPFTQRQAVCITDSGIVDLLDELCTSTSPAVATTSWAGFHFLAYRCAQWGADDGQLASEQPMQILSQQLSNMLSHHLQNMTQNARRASVLSDDINDLQPQKMQILNILDSLAGSHLGKAVVTGSQCILSLLQFLVDDASTPKLLKIVTRLLAVALPGLRESKELLDLVRGSDMLRGSLSGAPDEMSVKTAIVMVIMDKLSEVVVAPCKTHHVPGAVVNGKADSDEVTPLVSSTERMPTDAANLPPPSQTAQSGPSGTFVLKLFRRSNQTARDVIEPLLRNNRRGAGLFGARDPVENVTRLDSELNELSYAVAFRGTFATCSTVAMEWAQLGNIVSVERDFSTPSTGPSENSSAEVKMCKALNKSLSKRPVRWFVDGAVAGGIAHELIGLIQSLMAGSTCSWDEDVERVLGEYIGGIPALAPQLSCEDDMSPTPNALVLGRKALASMCVMGAFRDDIHAGGHALVGGDGLTASVGEVRAYEAQEGFARVQFTGVAAPLKVSVENLLSAHTTPPKRVIGLLNDSVMAAVDSLLATGHDQPMGVQSSSSSVDASASLVEFSHRLLADLRSRVCMLMFLKLRSGIKSAPSASSCGIIRRLAMEAQDSTDNSISLAEAACTTIRRPYFDQFRPQIPMMVRSDGSAYPDWDFAQIYPPIAGIILRNEKNGMKSVKVGRSERTNKKTFPIIFATGPLPLSSNFAYWEVKVGPFPDPSQYQSQTYHPHALEKYDNDNGWGCDGASQPGIDCPHSMGETVGQERYRCTQGWDFDLCGECMASSTAAEAFAVGFAPKTTRPGWKWPVDSVLISSDLRIRRRTTADAELVTSDAFRLEEMSTRKALPGDMVGCLLDKSKSEITFYLNGAKVTRPIPASASELVPVVHLKCPEVEIDTNLKVDPSKFPEGCADVINSAGAGNTSSSATAPADFHSISRDPPSAPTKVLGNFALPLSGSSMSGWHHVVIGEEEEEEEDMTEQLIQAWEREVFPRIHSRFRNSQERQTGYEQIRGALQFNMAEIAMETVAGLYDDSGGLPAEFHLPTIDDLRAAAGRLGANEIVSGMRVRNITTDATADYEIMGVEKTRMLTGTVVRVDTDRSLALVEMYVGSDASLMHWWYPCNVLELAEGAVENPDTDLEACHPEFLLCESKLTRLYARSALLMLNQHALVDLSIAQSLQLMSYESRSVVRPGACFVQTASAESFFNNGSAPAEALKSNLETALEMALSTGSEKRLLGELCGLLLPELGEVVEFVELSVRPDKKVYDVQFSSQLSDVLVSLRAKDGAASNLPTLSTDDGPWLRIYARSDCNGPRSAVYPCAESGTPYPYYVIPSSRLHVRIRPGDLPSGLEICLHGLHRDAPVALAFIQGPILTNEGVSQESMLHIADVLIANLSKNEAAPYMREVYHHTLAAIIRKAGPIFSSGVRSSIDALHAIGYTAVTIPEKPSEAHFSTFFQSIIELALADKVNSRLFQLYRGMGSASREISAASPPTSPGSAGSSDSTTSPKREKSKSKKHRKRHDSAKFKDWSGEINKRKRMGGSGSGTAKPESIVKSYIRRSADTELYLRRLVGWFDGDPRSGGDSGAPELACSMIDEDLIEMGYHRTLSTKVWESVIGFYRISSSLDNDELAATVKKLTKSCGGVASGLVFISPEHHGLGRCAVLQLKSSAVVNRVKSILKRCPQLKAGPDIAFFEVNLSMGNDLVAPLPDGEGDERMVQVGAAVEGFLKERALTGQTTLRPGVAEAFKDIFGLESFDSRPEIPVDMAELIDRFDRDDGDRTTPRGAYTTASVAGFLRSLGCDDQDDLAELLSMCEDDDVPPTALFGYTQVVCRDEPGRIFSAFVSYGFDLQFERYRYHDLEHALDATRGYRWLPESDALLVSEMDELSSALHVASPSLSASDYAPVLRDTQLLKDFDIAAIRLRMCALLMLNNRVADLLPAIDFRGVHLPRSLAHLIATARGLILYDVKIAWSDMMVDKTAQREDSNGPEVTLNPMDATRGKRAKVSDTHFMQALHQLEDIDPMLLRVKLARGGDPIFPINVRLTGEHVAGSSGSYREFMARMVIELHDGIVPLLLECPSAAFGQNVGCHILRPGALEYIGAKQLEMLGTIFGMAIRADVPMGLELLPVFWKALVGETLAVADLAMVDCSIAQRHANLLKCTTEEEFDALVEQEGVRLTFRNLNGEVVDIGPALLGGNDACGLDVPLTWALRDAYIKEVELERLNELRCKAHFDAIRRGMGTIVPLELLSVMAWKDLETRVCGRAYIDLAFLKAHTTYNAGLSETDPHIVFFWNALESFTQEQLRKFIKFACNQHRIPSGPCKDGTQAHVPPYPMKIAPPDRGRSDRRWIKAETCMFMIKLPQYSSQEVMNKRLLDALMYCDDLLIG